VTLPPHKALRELTQLAIDERYELIGDFRLAIPKFYQETRDFAF
jgi:hypothetical protein